MKFSYQVLLESELISADMELIKITQDNNMLEILLAHEILHQSLYQLRQ